MSPEGHRHLISKQSIMFHVFGYRLLNERGIHELTSSHDGKGKSSLSSFDKKGIHVLNKRLNVDSLTPTRVQMSSDDTPNLS